MSGAMADHSTEYATLTGLLERYSPSGSEEAAVGWLVARMQALGYSRAFRDPAGNAVGVMGSGPRLGVLLGHIDTVPGEIAVRRQGDKLYGRGAVDAKGPLAACVDAVARAGPLEGWQIIVVGAVDEERDSAGARFLVDKYAPDFAIIAEPSRWERVTLGYKGSAWAEITVRRPLGHSAGQEQSACESVVAVWQGILDWAGNFNTGRERVFNQLRPTLQAMGSGEDGFAAWAWLRVGVRLPPGFAPEEWYEWLEALTRPVPGRALEPAGYPVPAYQAEKNTFLVRAFLASIRAGGGKPGFVLKSGTADLNVVAPRWGCPAVAYGPGDSSLDHTPNEHISLEEYGWAVEVLQSVVQHLQV